MQFKRLSTLKAKGYQLGHNIKLNNQTLKKGSIVNKQSIQWLIKSNVTNIYVFIKNKDDVDENKAAKIIANHISTKDLYVDKPINGRADIYSKKNGMLIIEKNKLIKVNKRFDDLAICSLKSFSLVKVGQLVGNVKVLPYALSIKKISSLIKGISYKSIFSLKTTQIKRVALIFSVGNNNLKKSKIKSALETRLKLFGLKVNTVKETSHTTETLSYIINKVINENNIDLLLIYGSTSIADKNDVIPYSIKILKGKIISFGLPADPGNLALLASIGKVKVIGVPGCASSPKRNGFDIILERLCFGVNIDTNVIAEIGESGLFKNLIKKKHF